MLLSLFLLFPTYLVRGSVERIPQKNLYASRQSSPLGSVGKEFACNVGGIRDMGWIPGSEVSNRERNGNPLQYSCLKNPIDRGASGLQSGGSERVRHDWATKHRYLPSGNRCQMSYGFRSHQCRNPICIFWWVLVKHLWGFSSWLNKESACSVGDLGLILRWGRSPGEGLGYLLQYSCLENPLNRGAWYVTVHGVTKGRTRVSD